MLSSQHSSPLHSRLAQKHRKYRDSLIIPEALASCTCLFLLYPSELGTIGQIVATVCQLRMERQEYSYPALQ
jgi:hypothetical protein